MAYYEVEIEIWCDCSPAYSDLDDLTQGNIVKALSARNIADSC